MSDEINCLATLEKVKQLALKVGAMQQENLGRKNLKISKKSTEIDLVTEIDQKSEQMISEFIRTHYPDHGILAEESGMSNGKADYCWIVDPLDGTTNYSQGLPIFAVSIALTYCGEPVLGVVYAPAVGQLFTAAKGCGAELNGVKLQVSAKTELIDCVLATGFPYDRAHHPANNMCYFNDIALKARAVRRMGAAAYDLACVAAGRLDGYWELNLSPWDVAAGTLLVREAGGEIVHFRSDRKVSIIAGNATVCTAIHDQMKRVDAAVKKTGGDC